MALNRNGLKCLTFPSSSYELSVRSYVTTTDNLATITAANYFVGSGIVLRSGDLILTKATDGVALLQVDTVTSDANETISACTVKKFTTI